MPLSLDQFAAQVSASGLLSEAEVQSLRQGCGAADAEQFARELVKQKKLTAFQAQQCFSGKGRALTLSNYVVLDKLGQGGMGMVLKAQHRRMKRVVALKVLAPTVARSPELVARFQREVEAAARLTHPNIVAAYDADEANGTVFLVMEYVDGKDLSSLVKSKGPLPVDQAVECILQAARGLEYAHQRGVIHRDIKPANLLLSQEGTVKILDMGLARIEGETGGQAELTSTGAVMGTVDYMAPEQALSTKHADARSDVYSLGISLWYLLVGRPAYDGDSLMARLLAHREAPIPSLQGVRGEIPAALDAVFQKMIAKQPSDRWQSMTEVIGALQQSLSGDGGAPSMTRPPSEDSRLSAFLSQLGNASGPQSNAVGATAITVPIPAAAQFEATRTTAEADQATDPQTLTQLPTSPLAASTSRSRRRQSGGVGRTKARMWAVAGGLATVMLFGALLSRRSERTPGDAVPPPPATVTAGSPGPAPSAALDPPNFALRFDSTTCGVVLPRIDSDGANPLTVEAWVKPAVVPAENLPPQGECHLFSSPLLNLDYNLSTRAWFLQTRTEKTKYFMTRRAPHVETGDWMHVAGILDDRSLTLFVNGSRKFSEVLDAPLESGPQLQAIASMLGDGPENGRHRFQGLIDEFRISRGVRYADDFTPQRPLAADPETEVLFHFDEGSGDEIADASPHQRHIRMRDLAWGVKPAWERVDAAPADVPAARTSFALQFDGVDDVGVLPISLQEIGFFDPARPFTYELFATADAVQPKTGDRSRQPGLFGIFTVMSINWSDPLVLRIIGEKNLTATQRITSEAEHHYAVAWDGQFVRFFIDGKLQSELQPSAKTQEEQTWGSSQFTLAGLSENANNFAGRLRDVRISRVARYTADFAPPARLDSDDQTLGLYRLDEGTGTVLRDSSSAGRDGFVVGGTWVRLDAAAAEVSRTIATPPSPGSAATAPPQPRDLLALADPQRDGLVFNHDRNYWEPGGWTKLPDGWQSSEGPRHLLRLPHVLTAPAYSLAVDLELTGGTGGLWIVLPIGQTECYLSYNGNKRGDRGSAGFAYVDGLQETQNQTTVEHPRLRERELVRLTCDVDLSETDATIVARVNGAELTRFTGPTSRLSIPDFRQFADGRKLTFAVGSTNAQILYRRVELTEFPSGRPQPAGQAVPSAIGSAPAPGGEFALQFDGVDDVVDIPLTDAGLKLPVTIEAWMEVDEFAPGRGQMSLAHLIFGPQLLLSVQPERPQERPRISGKLDGVDPPMYAWQSIDLPLMRSHVALVADVERLDLYVDGKLTRRGSPSTGERTAHDWPPALSLGGRSTRGKFPPFWFRGRLSEIRLSSIARYDRNFVPPPRFETDEHTVGLYHCNEGAGEVLLDSSGHNRHGKVSGASWVRVDSGPTANVVAPPLRAQLNFDGRSSHVFIPTFQYDGRSPLTIEAWATPAEIDASGFVVLYFGGARGAFIEQRHRPTLRQPNHWSGNFITPAAGFGSLGTYGEVRSGQPYHLAFVGDGDAATLYVNGRPAPQKVRWQVGNQSGEPGLYIGGGPADGQDDPWFSGTIREVRVSSVARYTAAFTPPERHEPDAHTLALYRLDEGSGNVVHDSSGNGRDGTIVGCRWIVSRSDAAVTEWVRSLGGTIRGWLPGGAYQTINPDEPLPPGEISLHVVDLAKKPVRDEELSRFANLPDLGVLALSGSPLTVAGVRRLGQLPRLGALYLGGPGLNDEALAEIVGRFPQLEILHFGESRVTDAGVAVLRGCPHLQSLSLYKTPLTDGAVDVLSQLSSLRTLVVNSTGVTQAGADRLHAALPRCRIVWNGGEIPPENYALDLSKNGDETPPHVALPMLLSLTQPFTIECRVTPRSLALEREHRNIWHNRGRWELKQFGDRWVWCANGADLAAMNLVKSAVTVVPDQPTHLAGVFTGTELLLFVDGKLSGRTGFNVQFTEEALRPFIGHGPSFDPRAPEEGGYTCFDGLIDDIRISTTARYTVDFTPPIDLAVDADTLALYHCDDAEGAVLRDASRSHHGKIVNGRWAPVETAR